jgi:hybrid cluster-associated redox disulfide protein
VSICLRLRKEGSGRFCKSASVYRERAVPEKPRALADMSVDEIMRTWPQAIRVLIRYRMLCIGCPIGVFHTASDACREHDVGQEEFLRDLLEAISPPLRVTTFADSRRPVSDRADR